MNEDEGKCEEKSDLKENFIIFIIEMSLLQKLKDKHKTQNIKAFIRNGMAY